MIFAVVVVAFIPQNGMGIAGKMPIVSPRMNLTKNMEHGAGLKSLIRWALPQESPLPSPISPVTTE